MIEFKMSFHSVDASLELIESTKQSFHTLEKYTSSEVCTISTVYSKEGKQFKVHSQCHFMKNDVNASAVHDDIYIAVEEVQKKLKSQFSTIKEKSTEFVDFKVGE